MKKLLLIVLAFVLTFTMLLSSCKEADPNAPSTAPTHGMDFSFDKNDVEGTYDESDVVSIIQGDPVIIPDDSGEETSAYSDGSSENVSSVADDSSVAVPDDSSTAVPDDSSVIGPEDSSASEPDDSSSKTDDSSSKADDSSSKTDDSSSKADDSSSKADDSSSKTDDSSSKADDSSSKADDSSSKTDDSSSKPEDISSTAPAPTGDIYITVPGTHVLTGGFTNRKVIIEVVATKEVQLVLDNAVINNANGPAVYVKEGDKVTITAKAGTTNILADGSSYSFTDGTTTVDSAVFSLADLTINGTGKLTVKGNYKHGVVSKDNLIIAGCALDITSKSGALCGKDCVKITSGTLNINAGSNGIVSDNTEDSTRGYIYFEGGTVSVVAGYDGIQAETIIKSNNTAVTVKAGGGSGTMLNNATQSYKAMKAGSDILISGGTYKLDSRDDCIHSNNTVNITGGTLTLSSGDDGIHANTDLAISGGTMSITKSYEGIEASRILISGGNISVVASDDGLNAAGGTDSSGMGQGGFTSSKGEIIISGGYILVNAGGDGIDSNGTISVSGGVTLVSGPTNGGNGIFDYDGSATVTGGVVVALGTSGMAQNFSTAQNQGSMLCTFSSQAAGTSFAVCDSTGKVIVSFTNKKSYQCAVVTAPGIQSGNTYTLVAGATVSGADANGFAQNTTKTGGTTLATVNMTSNLYGTGGGMGGGIGGGGRPPR